MFTSASGIPSLGRRLRDDKGVNTESILDDVLADVSADDVDREREKRRRRASKHPVGHTVYLFRSLLYQVLVQKMISVFCLLVYWFKARCDRVVK